MHFDGTVSVIATATNTVIGSPIAVGSFSEGVAVTPDGSKVYVTNEGSGTVSVIATASNTVIGSPIAVGSDPFGVAVTPDGSKVYVANAGSNGVSVIATATNTVIAPIAVGSGPFAFGVFIPAPVVQSAPASGSLCNGVYDGTFNGNITGPPVRIAHFSTAAGSLATSLWAAETLFSTAHR